MSRRTVIQMDTTNQSADWIRTVRKRRRAEAGLPPEFPEVEKGDYPGHPFRGNQWTGGISRGGAKSNRRGGRSALNAIEWAATEMTEEDAAYSEAMLEEIRSGKSINYLMEGSSYYDEIDWESDVDPVTQMAESFTKYTGIAVDGLTPRITSSLEVEAVAEMFDAVTVLTTDWPGVQLDAINFTKSGQLKAGTYMAAGPLRPGAAASGGKADFATSGDNVRYTIFVPAARFSTEKAERTRASIISDSRPDPNGKRWTADTGLTPIQSTIVHEFGHIVEFNLWAKSPRNLVLIQRDWLKKTVGDDPYIKGFLETSDHYTYIPEVLARFPGGKNPLRNLFSEIPMGVIPFRSLLSEDVRASAVTKAAASLVSTYSKKNGAEFFAELFAMSYGNIGNRLSREQKRAVDDFKDIIEGYWPDIERDL